MNDETTQNGVGMDAGRALDIRMGREVMGWEPWYVVDEDAPFFTPRVPDGPPDLLDYWTTDSERVPCGWSPSAEIADAWGVHREMCSRSFSVRQRYFRALAESVRSRIANPVAWPDLFAFLEPIDFCRAALLALEAR